MGIDIGRLAEQLVDASFAFYDNLWWSPTWPEVVFVGKGQAVATGRALPDRIVLIDGQLVMIEIKTWEAKDKHTLRKRLHQYSTMCNASACGADCFYLVLWRWKGKEEWRLYPVLDLTESNGGIVFWRDKGYYVPGEVPDWLNAYASSFRR